jgi:hypothetical protein
MFTPSRKALAILDFPLEDGELLPQDQIFE